MIFNIIAILVITFFAALGMVDFSSRLLKSPLYKSMKKKVFIVLNVDSVKEEDIEAAVWTVFSQSDYQSTDILLDCRGISPKKSEICEELRKKYEIFPLQTEEEMLRFFKDSLQKENNII